VKDALREYGGPSPSSPQPGASCRSWWACSPATPSRHAAPSIPFRDPLGGGRRPACIPCGPVPAEITGGGAAAAEGGGDAAVKPRIDDRHRPAEERCSAASPGRTGRDAGGAGGGPATPTGRPRSRNSRVRKPWRPGHPHRRRASGTGPGTGRSRRPAGHRLDRHRRRRRPEHHEERHAVSGLAGEAAMPRATCWSARTPPCSRAACAPC